MLKNKYKVKKKLFIIGIVVFLVLLLDQAIKIYVKTSFSSNESHFIFGEWFGLNYIENPGMAFGKTFGSEIWHKLALSLFRVTAIIFIGVEVNWHNFWIAAINEPNCLIGSFRLRQTKPITKNLYLSKNY